MKYDFKILPLKMERSHNRTIQARKNTSALLKGEVVVKLTLPNSCSLNIQLRIGDLPVNGNFIPKGCEHLKYHRVISCGYNGVKSGDRLLAIKNKPTIWKDIQLHIVKAIEELQFTPKSNIITVLMSDSVKAAIGLKDRPVKAASIPKEDMASKAKEAVLRRIERIENAGKKNEQVIPEKTKTMEINTDRLLDCKICPEVDFKDNKCELEVVMELHSSSFRFRLKNDRNLATVRKNCVKPKEPKWEYIIHDFGRGLTGFVHSFVEASEKCQEMIKDFFGGYGINIKFV